MEFPCAEITTVMNEIDSLKKKQDKTSVVANLKKQPYRLNNQQDLVSREFFSCYLSYVQ